MVEVVAGEEAKVDAVMGKARRTLEVARKIKATFSVSNARSMAIMPIVAQERRKRRRRITLVRRWSQR